MAIPDPTTTEWIPIWSQVPVPPALHHATHETNGVDALTQLSANILTSGTLPDARLSANVAMNGQAAVFTTLLSTPLNASNLTSGTVPDARLSANVALLNAANVFTQNQTMPSAVVNGKLTMGGANPFIAWKKTGLPVDTSVWHHFARGDGDLQWYPVNDAESIAQNNGVMFTRAGGITVNGPNTFGDTYFVDNPARGDIRWYMNLRTNGADLKKWMFHMNSSGNFYLGAWNDAENGWLGPGSYTAISRATNTWQFPNHVQTTGYLYPGRIHGPAGLQLSYYIAGSDSYGLHSNTGLHLVGSLWTDAGLSVAGGASIGATLGVTGLVTFSAGCNLTGTLTVNTVNVNVGPLTVSQYISSSGVMYPGDVTTGAAQTSYYWAYHPSWASMYTNGNIMAAAHIYNYGYMYPGRNDGSGSWQGSWYIAGHSSYGLYINTGLYIAGNVWTGANIYVGALGWLGNAAIQNGLTGTTGTILFNGTYVTLNFTNGVLTSVT